MDKSIISSDISKAVDILNDEDVIAIPTETVYGLAGNIYSKKAISRIFEVKQRPLFNPLIVHVPSIDVAQQITSRFPEKAKQLAEKFWPGSLTLVLPKNENIPDLITAGKNTVGIRVPNHPVTLELLNNLDFPLAAPSANPFNRISPTSAQHVEKYFKDKISMVLEGGPCQNGLESTIIGFEDDQPILYRLGSISIEEIEAVIGKIEVKNKSEASPNAPGMLSKHYSPKTKLYFVKNIEELLPSLPDQKIAAIRYSKDLKNDKVHLVKVLSKTADLKEAASKLYQTLHSLDEMDFDAIIAEHFPEEGLGISINDRLKRASQ